VLDRYSIICEILPAIPSREFINVVPRLAFIAARDFAKVAPHKRQTTGRRRGVADAALVRRHRQRQ
jgi:hypothetical protein